MWSLLWFLVIQRLDLHPPLGSSACLASLRRAAANPEFADWATVFPLVSGLRGLTVAVVRVAAEIIPKVGDLLGSWFIPEEESTKRCVKKADVTILFTTFNKTQTVQLVIASSITSF